MHFYIFSTHLRKESIHERKKSLIRLTSESGSQNTDTVEILTEIEKSEVNFVCYRIFFFFFFWWNEILRLDIGKQCYFNSINEFIRFNKLDEHMDIYKFLSSFLGTIT